jgi:hypothetical protein
MPELSPEGEAIAAYGAATMAAVKILVICLQANGALEHGQFPEALRLYMEAAKDDADDMTLSILHDLDQINSPIGHDAGHNRPLQKHDLNEQGSRTLI